jgi:hypothetical protein
VELSIFKLSCVGFLLSNLMMDSFVCLIMNTICVHDIISNEEVLPTSPKYDISNIVMCKLPTKLGR